MKRRRQTLLICLGLAVLTVTALVRVLGCDFIDYDDPSYVVGNPHVNSGLSAANIAWAFTNVEAFNWQPLTWLSLQLDASLYRLNPAGYHLTNLILHTANVVLLFLVLRGMTGAVWRSAAVAAFFGVHPLHVESVAWVADRKDVLGTLFWMLTLAAYGAYVRRPGVRRYLLLLVPFILGLLATPLVMTLPVVLCLLDYWPLRRFSWSPGHAAAAGDIPPASFWREAGEKLPLLLLAVLVWQLTLAVQPATLTPLGDLPFDFRLLNAFASVVAYLGGVFWPFGLSVLYPHPRRAIALWPARSAGLVLLAVSFVVPLLRRRYPYLLVGWLWFLVTLLPVLGLMQGGAEARADRYTYVPLIGVFLMLVWGVSDPLARWRRPEIVLVPLTAVLLGACVVVTWLQVGTWRNSITLWEHAAAVDPHNGYAHLRLSYAYAREERWDEALASARAAVANEPKNVQYRLRVAALWRQLHGQSAAGEEPDESMRQLFPPPAQP